MKDTIFSKEVNSICSGFFVSLFRKIKKFLHIYKCDGLTLAGCQVPTKPFSHSLSLTEQ